MSKNFHRDYADSVGHFCQSVPSQLGLSPQEVDTYFRACTLCLWAASGGRGGDVIGINQIYTDRQVKFSSEQFEKAMAFYQKNPNYTVGVPEFFQKLCAADAKNGTAYSRNFAEVQKNLLMLCAAYDGSFSFAESRRITLLYEQLTHACDQAGVPAAPVTPGPEDYLGSAPSLSGASRDVIQPPEASERPPRSPDGNPGKELNDLMDELDKAMTSRTRGLFDDFFGAPKKPSGVPGDPNNPLPVTEGPQEPVKPDAAAGAAAEAEEPEPPKPTLEEAMAELDQHIGLEVVKKDVDSLVNLVKVRKLRQERSMKTPDMSFHLVFSGNPM